MRSQQIEAIVDEVLQRLGHASGAPKPAASQGEWGVFERLEDAVAAAEAARKGIETLAVRERVIAAIRRAARLNARRLAEMAVDETGMGRVEDKVKKNLLVADRTPGPEILFPSAMSGDMGLTLVENAPWGVIASVTPSTNPAATVINNGISMISGGNAVIFAPHPSAKRTTQEAIRILNKAVHEETGVGCLMACVKEPTIDVAKQLFTYPGIDLLVVTGGEAVVHAARKTTDKRLIAAGAGNPPVVVDETADLARAARGIYEGASFDNNVICCDEKEILVVEAVADGLKRELAAAGAKRSPWRRPRPWPRPWCWTTRPDVPRQPQVGGPRRRCVAKAGGFSVPDSCRLLFVDVGRDVDHVFARVELMMPILPCCGRATSPRPGLALRLERACATRPGCIRATLRTWTPWPGG